MSAELLSYVRNYLNHSVDTQLFVDEYITKWKKERDNLHLLDDPPVLSEVLSSIFCFADLYSPTAERENYEFDEHMLRKRITEQLERIELE